MASAFFPVDEGIQQFYCRELLRRMSECCEGWPWRTANREVGLVLEVSRREDTMDLVAGVFSTTKSKRIPATYSVRPDELPLLFPGAL